MTTPPKKHTDLIPDPYSDYVPGCDICGAVMVRCGLLSRNRTDGKTIRQVVAYACGAGAARDRPTAVQHGANAEWAVTTSRWNNWEDRGTCVNAINMARKLRLDLEDRS